MAMSSFWGYFEENAVQEKSDINLGVQTQTRAREENDQRVIAQTTSTFTATREEPDQDTNNNVYRAIPTTKIIFTKTLTEQREENDQDSGHFKYSTFPFK